MSKIETVWLQYKSALSAFLKSRVSDPDDVDDLLQEILLKTYQNIHQLKDTRKLKSWLFQIANHSLVDHYRKNHRRDETDLTDLTEISSTEDAFQGMEACVLPFIESLPDEQRDMLRAIELEGMSQKHYAQSKGLNYSTLKSQVQNSRKALYGVFSQCCHFSLDAKGNLIEVQPKKSGCGPC